MRLLVGPDTREDPTCQLMAERPLDARVGLPTDATAFRRDAFVSAGDFLGGEDALFALDLYRAGG